VLEKKVNWLQSSLILTEEECLSLVQMTLSLDGTLLYRATRDGFTAEAFHLKCDEKPNTVTIIKNNLNCVFGGCVFDGYTTSKARSDRKSGWCADLKAFIFSLRRFGVSKNDKFMVTGAHHAIYGRLDRGPIFGDGHDICIIDRSDKNMGSYTNFGRSYASPTGHINTKNYLAGNYDKWLTTEIEVYQINNYIL
jgi:hypothetical protein